MFPRTQATDFHLSTIAPKLSHPFPDVTFLVTHFNFSTIHGTASGVVNLVYDSHNTAWRAFTCLTLLEGIHDHPHRVGAKRIRGVHNEKVSYDERRAEQARFDQEDPDVLIVGAGHNGLVVAAQLSSMGIKSLVIDRQKRVGDNWRTRYRCVAVR